jgi:hypothetical protein
MKRSNNWCQRGQATTEFLAAMALFVPLFFGIVYVGKISDIKHQAIQASRYAALETALDPTTTPVQAQEEATRARFFTDGARNDGKLQTGDTTAGLQTDGTTNPLWYEVNGTPLLQTYSDPNSGVRIAVTSNSMDIGTFTPVNEGSSLFGHLNKNGQVQADVEVPIANITHLPAPLNALNLSVGARTVVAGDTWSGAGSQDVASQQTGLTDAGRDPILKPLQTLITPWALLFSDQPQGPQLGCVSPDVVPDQTAPGSNSASGFVCD